MNVESKKLAINASPEDIYNIVGNFNNFEQLVPSQVEGWCSTEDTCSFKVSGFMQITLKMAEKCPYSKVVISPDTSTTSPFPFRLIFEMEENSSRTDTIASIEVDANPMMLMMVKKQMKTAVDTIVEQLKYFVENRS